MERQLHYVSNLPENDLESIECKICYQIPNRIKLLNCCRQKICTLCVYDWFEAHLTCPYCRSDICHELIKRGLPDDAPGQKILDEFIVFCPYLDFKCDWVGKRSDLFQHLKKECNVGKIARKEGALKISEFRLTRQWKLKSNAFPPVSENVVVDIDSHSINMQPKNKICHLISLYINFLLGFIAIGVIAWVILTQVL